LNRKILISASVLKKYMQYLNEFSKSCEKSKTSACHKDFQECHGDNITENDAMLVLIRDLPL